MESEYKTQILVIKDKNELNRAYMPYLRSGGLFLKFNEEITSDIIYPGQKVNLLLTLFSDAPIPVWGKVVWINYGNNNKGYGISFGENSAMKELKENIEFLLAEYNGKNDNTYTF